MADEINTVFRVHAILRMAERDISRSDVEHVINSGEIIEKYDDDQPHPSRLFFAVVNSKPLHVVAAWNAEDREWIVITAYEPTIDRWYPDFKRRRP